jgi:mRNA-degrading endonuclease toxin of MazEF toxin-antitoxin module
MAGPHFALVMSPQSYSKRSGMAIVLLASSKIRSESHPRYSNTQPIPRGLISPTRDNPSGEGVLFCDAVRQIDWRERSAAFAGAAPPEYVEQALDRLLGVLEEDE